MKHLMICEDYSHEAKRADVIFKKLINNIKLTPSPSRKFYILNIEGNDSKFGPDYFIKIDDNVNIFNVLVYKDNFDVRVQLFSSLHSMYKPDAKEFNDLIHTDNFIDAILNDYSDERSDEILNKYIDIIGFDDYRGEKYGHLADTKELGLI